MHLSCQGYSDSGYSDSASNSRKNKIGRIAFSDTIIRRYIVASDNII